MTEAIMTFDIGQMTLAPAAFSPSATPVAEVALPAAPAPATVIDRSDVVPVSPPPEVLAEVDAAWQRTMDLANENRELHFARDETTGRVIIEVRSLDGEVLKTIPPSKALDVMSGGRL
jgi:FlaG protein